MFELKEITIKNIHWYCRFEKTFEDDLKNFQSRIYPHHSDFFVPLTEQKMLRWSYIMYNGNPIGAIWLEKDHPSLRTASMGIFIAEKELRCKGIGRKAIERFIQNSKKELNLKEITLDVRKENIRAIRCYEKCGFSTEREYEKSYGVKALKMVKIL